MQVLGVRDEWEKDQDAERVGPPQAAGRGRGGWHEEGRQVRDHQGEDEEGDDARFVRHLAAKPDGTHEEAAHEKTGDADRDKQRKGGGEPEVEAADPAVGIEEAEAKAGGEMVERDERKGEKSPEDESVGETGERALLDDFGLADDFPEEVPDALADGRDVEVGIFARSKDVPEYAIEAPEETDQRKNHEDGQQHDLCR